MVLSDEPDGFGTGRHAGANNFGEASELVGKGFGPGGGVRSLQEVTVLLDLAGDGVDDHIGLINRRWHCWHDGADESARDSDGAWLLVSDI